MKRQRIIIQALLIALGLFTFVFGVLECLPKEKCYSYEYSIYLELKGITNVDEVREQLQTLKLEYTLQNNKLTLDNYQNIVFDVLDDKTCAIASNTTMSNFEMMDSGTIVDMTFDGLLEYDGIQETITLKDGEYTYIKRSNNYFIQTPAAPARPAFCFIVTAATWFIAYSLGFTAKKRRKVKLQAKPQASTTANSTATK